MNEDQNYVGYDSAGAIGPFFDAVRDKPPLRVPDEEEILNGLSPSPQVEMKFDLQKKNPTNGSDFCFKAFGSCAR